MWFGSCLRHPSSVRPGRAPKAESRNGPLQTVGANDLTCPEALPWEDLEIDRAKKFQHISALCKEGTSYSDIEDRDSDSFRPLDGFLGFLDDCMKCNSDAQIALQRRAAEGENSH